MACWCVQGQAMGSAAHLVALRREAIGQYHVKDAWTVDQLQATFGKRKQTAQGQQQQQQEDTEQTEGILPAATENAAGVS